VSLADCEAGQNVVLAALTSSSTEFLEFLNCRNLSLETQITIHSQEAYDQSMVVSYLNHSKETLSEKVCEKLLVKIIGE
jgi:DtxR family Mn-dependent transcriptional regulator